MRPAGIKALGQFQELAKRSDRIGKLSIKHLLISRVDAIGDVLLTLPLLGLLKQNHPTLKISFLGRTYTQAILAACQHVDGFVNWDDIFDQDLPAQASTVGALGCDAVLHVFPQKQVARACRAAGVPWRLGTANRLYHWGSCNRLTVMGRAKSPWHEAQLNIYLAQRLGLLPDLRHMPALTELPKYYGLAVQPMGAQQFLQSLLPNVLAPDVLEKFQAPDVMKVILHPGSRGSARDWPPSHFVQLSQALMAAGAVVIVTGTAAEGEALRPVFGSVFAKGVIDATGRLSLTELMQFIAACDALVAASTGPLHMAAALGKRAVGIYPPIRPMHAGRWGPVGRHAQAVWSGPPDCSACQSGEVCACVQSVSPVRVLETVLSSAEARASDACA